MSNTDPQKKLSNTDPQKKLSVKSLHTREILKSRVISHFLKSTSNDVTDICPNPNPNQLIGHRSENLKGG